MNAAVKYSLGRLGLFLAVLAGLWPVPLNIFIKLMIALIFSAALSLIFLRAWRDEMANELAAAAERRRAEKQRLRAALAGDEAAPTAPESAARPEPAARPDPPAEPPGERAP